MAADIFRTLLNHDFALARLRRTPNGQGGWAVDYVPTGNVRGRLRPTGTAESEAAALEQRGITHVFYCEYGVDIQRGDRVEGGGLTVYVDGVREPSTAHQHLEVDCSTTQVEATLPEES